MMAKVPSKRWWEWVWPFSKSSQRVSPDSKDEAHKNATTPSGAPLAKRHILQGSQSYPTVANHNLQAQGTQTYKNEGALLSPRRLRSMQKFPVDDDEFLVEDVSGNISSSMSDMNEDNSEHNIPSDENEPPKLELETDIFHTANSNSDPFYAPYGFIIMCFFQIIWGLAGVIQVAIFRYTKTLAQTFILLDRNFSDHSSFYLLAAASLTTIGGISGLIALTFNIQFILHLIPHLMWIIVTMFLSSSITARGNLEKPTVSTYYRLFEAAMYSKDPSYLKKSWPNTPHTIWEEMQKTMRCCGVENMADWLHLPDPKIPESCCLDDLIRPCQRALSTWTSRNLSKTELISSLRDVKKYLHDDSCITVLTVERGNHIRDWTTYPLIYLAFHLLMMFNLNYLTQILIREHRTWQGLARLNLFKSQSTDLLKLRLIAALLGMIPFCCNRMKAKARWKVEKQASHNVLAGIQRRRKSTADSDDPPTLHQATDEVPGDKKGKMQLPQNSANTEVPLIVIDKGVAKSPNKVPITNIVNPNDSGKNTSEWTYKRNNT